MNRLILDTEATPITKGVVDGSQSLVYDLGYLIVDGDFNIVHEKNTIIEDIFSNMSLMQNAYYREKLPQYFESMRDKKSNLECMNFNDAFKMFRVDCKAYNVGEVWAYNCTYDRQALNNTLSYCSNGFAHYFIPYGISWHDVWDYAQCITGTKKFVKFCIDNDYLTKNKRPMTKVDIVGKYLWGSDFVENHTALSDAKDETKILESAMRRKQKAHTTIGKGGCEAYKTYKLMQI